MNKLSPEMVNQILALRKEGRSYSYITSTLGVSKGSAVYYINPEAAARRLERQRVYRKEKYEERRAYRRQNYTRVTIDGVRKNIIVRKRPRPDSSCELCHNFTSRLVYHHWDDEHREYGMWLCLSCNNGVELIERLGSGVIELYLSFKKSIEDEQLKKKEVNNG